MCLVTKCDTFTVKVSTAASDTHTAGTETSPTLTVNKANDTATAPTAKTVTYYSSAQELVNAGSTNDGTLYCAVTTENKAPTDEKLYTTSIPSKIDAGTYYVWYKAVGDANHKDSEPESVIVVIAEKVVYTIVSADGSEHVIGEGKKTIITVKRSVEDDKTFGLYTGSTMDGKEMPAGSHSTAAGSLILTLNSSYLDTLSEGNHKVIVSFSDGSADTTITVKKPAPVPKTGDTANPMLWLAVVLLGLLCAGGVIVRTAKKRG